jgi:hypothetical protein
LFVERFDQRRGDPRKIEACDPQRLDRATAQ